MFFKPFIYLYFHLFQLFSNVLIRLSLFSRIHKFTHQTILETIWTLLPVIIVFSIAVPSFILLYAIDVMVDSAITIKAIGKQWYWNYEVEYPSLYVKNKNLLLKFKRRIFDSYMLNTQDLISGQLRLLEVDQPLLFPIKTHIDLVVTAEDVLHSFSLPSVGVKVDAVPGRLNHAGIFIERPSVLYGQCSELCGTNHAFMPIKVLAMTYDSFVYSNQKLA
jgi:cytochrome c oxidase subunit 2